MHYADVSLSSVCCDDWNLRSSLPTTTDVRKRLSHKIRPPARPTEGSLDLARSLALARTCDAANLGIIFETTKKKGENLFIELSEVIEIGLQAHASPFP